MGIILENALLCDLDPPRVEHGALRIDGGMIVQRGEHVDRGLGDERVDCRGAVVLPGFGQRPFSFVLVVGDGNARTRQAAAGLFADTSVCVVAVGSGVGP